MEEDRAAIIKFYLQGKSPSEIFKFMDFPKTRRKLIYRTIKRYRDIGNTTDRSRSGRPVSATNIRNRKVVRSRIWRNPRRSMRKIASEIKISRESRTIVKRDLGLFPYKRRKVHFTSAAIKQKRLARSKILRDRFASHGLDQIIFSDEKLFTVEQALNTQNDRILSSSSSTIPDEYRLVKSTETSVSDGLGRNIRKRPHSPSFYPTRRENQCCQVSRTRFKAYSERSW